MTVSLSMLSSAARADVAVERTLINVAADRAAISITAFADQAHLNVLFRGQQVEDVITNAVSGSFAPAEALERIIAGTPLTFVMSNARTITVWSCKEFACEPSGSSDSQPRPAANSESTAGTTAAAAVEQVDVNGNRIPHDSFAPQPSLEKVIVSKEQIEQSGAVTLTDALRSLTQILNGGVTEGNIPNGREARSNGNHATSLNVRGLGAASTLVLLNGHRTVKGGTDSMYTESDMFPLEGLQGVDLLLDGPPLRYGADTIGGVINIITNTRFTGASTEIQNNGLTAAARREYRLGHLQGWKLGNTHLELAFELRQQTALPASRRAQYTNDLTRFGGSDFRTPYSQPGTLLAAGETYAIPANPPAQAGTGFTPNTANLTDQLADSDVLPRQRRWNTYLEIDHDFGAGLTGTAESLCSYRRVSDTAGSYTAAISVDDSNPFYINPSGATGPVVVLYKFSRELGSTIQTAHVTTCDSSVSVEARSFGGWRLNTSLTYGTHRQQEITTGLIDFAALTRALTLELGAAYRREALTSGLRESQSQPEITARLSRTIRSAFAALAIPLPGSATLGASGRFDHYSDFGNVFSPEYILTVTPSPSLSIRGSWARLFRPPNITQLVESNNLTQIITLPDLRSPTGTTTALITSGGNSSLAQERARNWALRLDFKPPALAGLRAGLNYFRIDSEDLIEDLLFQSDILNDPAFRSTVIRNPTEAQRRAVCATGQFAGGAQSCLTTPIGAIVDLRTRNTARLTTSGVDFDAAYTWQLARHWGEVDAVVRATYVFDFSAAATADSPNIQLRNTANNPVDLRVRPLLQWRLQRVAALLAVNYRNHYRDTLSIPNRNVASWTTVDTQASYKVDAVGRPALAGTEILLTASNLFGRDPPFVNNPLGVGYDVVNGNLASGSSASRFASSGRGIPEPSVTCTTDRRPCAAASV